MNFNTTILPLLLLLSLSLSHAWLLEWYDDFSSPSLDTTKWNTRNGTTIEGQSQLFLEDNVFVANGSLFIRLKREEVSNGSYVFPFSSGFIDSHLKFSQKFGRFSIRAKLPSLAIHGISPAFFLLPEYVDDDNNHLSQSCNRDEENGEKMSQNGGKMSEIKEKTKESMYLSPCWPVGGAIDAMRAVGGEDEDTVGGELHYGKNCSEIEELMNNNNDNNDNDDEKRMIKERISADLCTCGCGCDLRDGPFGHYYPGGNSSAVPDFSQDFHIFSVEWDETSLFWLVDEDIYWQRYSDKKKQGHPKVPIPSTPFFFTFMTTFDNSTVASGKGKKEINDGDYFDFEIDWVKVFSD